MIIEIDDDLPPTKRRELLKTLPIKYGMDQGWTMIKTSEFLGFSYRYVRNTVIEYDYLSNLKDVEYLQTGIEYDPKLWGQS